MQSGQASSRLSGLSILFAITIGTPMKHRKTLQGLVFVAILSLLSGMLAVYFGSPDENAVPLARKLERNGTSLQEQSMAPRSTSTLPLTIANATPPQDNDDSDKTILDKWREKVFEQHSDIAEFAKYNRRILKTLDDRTSFERMLADREMISQAKQDLLDSNIEYSEIEQRKRMYRIEYLGAAIRSQDNPERALAIEAIEDVIFANNIKFDSSEEQKHSLAGDKVELYWALIEHDPAQAALVAEKAKGTEFESILTYARRKWDSIMNADKSGG